MTKRLQDFFHRYGKQTTTNFDLAKIAEKENIEPFHVVMRDEVKDLPKETPLYGVTNIHTSKERGVHWSAFAKTPKGNFFFDSYGLPPTQEVKDFLSHATYNTFTLQKPGTTECGQLSLFMLKELATEPSRFTTTILSLRRNDSPSKNNVSSPLRG